jgi:hypothetical protein
MLSQHPAGTGTPKQGSFTQPLLNLSLQLLRRVRCTSRSVGVRCDPSDGAGAGVTHDSREVRGARWWLWERSACVGVGACGVLAWMVATYQPRAFELTLCIDSGGTVEVTLLIINKADGAAEG